MLNQALVILSTAALSSLFTITVFYFLYQKRLRHELDEKLAAAREEFERTLDATLEEVGTLVEERVRQGVVKGVASISTPEVLTDTTKSVAKTGAELAERGLKALLGKGRRGGS
ncbi:MAG: hypothetical protein K0U98_04830 [Deltaproteobacteria bacterium]|nr:hypothetical protein [Deltaproteobacteria bacterium]